MCAAWVALACTLALAGCSCAALDAASPAATESSTAAAPAASTQGSAQAGAQDPVQATAGSQASSSKAQPSSDGAAASTPTAAASSATDATASATSSAAAPDASASAPATATSEGPAASPDAPQPVDLEALSIGQLDLSAIPPYTDAPSIVVNSNFPFFTTADLARTEPFEDYSPLDELGRCGAATALVGEETMPQQNEERGQIGNVHPSGWSYERYEWVDGKYLFNRCHLIAWMLGAENDNAQNLITGTRSMNTQGMLPYEEQVAHYIWRTGNHVLYRATPVFEGSNLVATGVLLEAQSLEDGGEGVKFCAFCYNAEPGVAIDYATGNSRATGTRSLSAPEQEESTDWTQFAFVVNKNSGKFHLPDCPSVSDMKEHNKLGSNETAEALIAQGYSPCGVCKPAG